MAEIKRSDDWDRGKRISNFINRFCKKHSNFEVKCLHPEILCYTKYRGECYAYRIQCKKLPFYQR